MNIDNTIPNIPIVSASKIKTYKTCARQYKYKYVIPFKDRPSEDKNVAALLGTALHKAIELKYSSNAAPTAIFQNVMEETITQWEKDKVKINAPGYYTQALKVGKDILRKFDWTQFTPTELEYAFTLPFPSPLNPLVNVTGYIDLVDRKRKIVVDFKSQSVAPSQEELDHDPQFLLYAWAYEQIYAEKPDNIIWYHLRTDKKMIAYVQHNYEDKIAQLTEDILAMLEAKRFGRRQMDSICKTKCSYFDLCYGTKANHVVVEDNE